MSGKKPIDDDIKVLIKQLHSERMKSFQVMLRGGSASRCDPALQLNSAIEIFVSSLAKEYDLRDIDLSFTLK